MPFDPDAYLAKKKAFDPNAYLASKGAPAKPVVPIDSQEGVGIGASPLLEQAYAGLVGAGQGLTLGFGDEIAAGLRSAVSDKTYKQERDTLRADQDQLQQNNPMTYGGAELAGSIASPLNKLPGAAGVTQGLIAGAGNAKETDLQGAQDTLESGALAGTIGLGLKGVGQVAKTDAAKGLADWFKSGARDAMVKGSFRPGNAALSKEIGSETLGKLGQAADTVLDNVKLSPFDTRRDLLKKALGAQKSSGAELGTYMDPAATTGRDDLVLGFMQKAEDAMAKSQTKQAAAYEKQAQKLSELPQDKLPLENLRNLRNESAEAAKLGKGVSDPYEKQVTHALTDAEESLVSPDKLDAYKGEKGTYEGLTNAIKPLKGSAAREFKHTSGPIAGWKDLITKPLSPVLDRYPQAKSWGLNLGAKVAGNPAWTDTLSQAYDRGGSAAVSTAHYLLTQRDPEYRKAHQDDQDASKDQ